MRTSLNVPAVRLCPLSPLPPDLVLLLQGLLLRNFPVDLLLSGPAFDRFSPTLKYRPNAARLLPSSLDHACVYPQAEKAGLSV